MLAHAVHIKTWMVSVLNESQEKGTLQNLLTEMHFLRRIQANQLCEWTHKDMGVQLHKGECGIHVFNRIIMHICKGCQELHRSCLPGVSLTVVLSGYNVFKKLSSCHSGMEEEKERAKDRMRQGSQRKKLLAYTNESQLCAWIKCHCGCVHRIYSQVKD